MHVRPPTAGRGLQRYQPGGRRCAFSLIEILVAIAVLSVLISLLLPTLAGAREAGRRAVCLSNLRQSYVACRMYADEHAGLGPAIGWPWGERPFWALEVRARSGASWEAGHDLDLYSGRSVLVCPSVDAAYAEAMTRTYAMNATGHAGLTPPEGPADPDDYDAGPAHIDLDRVIFPSSVPLLVDSAVAFIPDDAPPPTRTSGVLDFRQASHRGKRLGRFHSGGVFDASMLDGSARSHREIMSLWHDPLP